MEGDVMRSERKYCAGFTIIELLVVIAVLSIIVALLLPAVQQARESARRATCTNNLRQLGTALHQYHDVHVRFPPGFIQRDQNDVAAHVGFGWGAMILPQLEEGALFELIEPQFTASVPSFSERALAIWRCPSDPDVYGLARLEVEGSGGCSVNCGSRPCPTRPSCENHGGIWNSVGKQSFAARGSYIGNFGNHPKVFVGDGNGVMFVNSSLKIQRINDGTTNTILLGERKMMNGDATWEGVHFEIDVEQGGCDVNCGVKPCPTRQSCENHDGTWAPGNLGYVNSQSGRHVLATTGVGTPVVANDFGFSSAHTTGCMMLMCDGSTKFISESIDIETWHNLGQRDDGNVVSNF